jgi:Bax inhibitor 1
MCVCVYANSSPQVQQHLVRVYASLSVCLLVASCAAVFLPVALPPLLSALASVGLLMAIASLPATDANQASRFGLLLAFAAVLGCSVGPLVHLVHDQIAPSVVYTALLATASLFACFSGAALLSRRRSYLYLGGILSSALSWLLVLNLMNAFFPSEGMFDATILLGLAVFSGYVVFDTQLIVEKASLGDRDYVLHSAELFIDFVGLFVRILALLAKKEKKKK